MKKSSDFANRLKILIDESGLTYEEFGKKVGVSGPTLNRYVLGQRIPKVDIANKIAESIGINPLWLHGFDVPRDVDKVKPAEEIDRLKGELIDLASQMDEKQLRLAVEYVRILKEIPQRDIKK